MKNFFLIGLLFIMTISCEKDSIETYPEIINGIWIESAHKTDTLVFENDRTNFTLNRGMQIRATGPYTYEIRHDTILLKWLFSSYSGNGIEYYFEFDVEKEQFKIGNFFVDSLDSKTELTFSKIN